MKDQFIVKICEGEQSNSQQPGGHRCVVEVFKTNVEHETEAKELTEMIRQRFPASRVNFDLQDRDRILRVEGTDVCIDTIIGIMKTAGFTCTVLD